VLLLIYGFSGWFTRGGLVVYQRIGRFVIVAVVCSTAVLLYAWHFWPEPEPPPPPVAISFRLGCSLEQIPIRIPPASTIHVLRLHPAILYGNPRIKDLGVFENISSPSDKPMEWPNKTDGRWMTTKERKQSFSGGMPNPYASDCTLTSYSPQATLDEITAYLLVDILDPTKPKSIPPAVKRFSFSVAFDPLTSAQPFRFHIVNTCSSGDIPVMVQWADSATIRVLGEPTPRTVPFKQQRLTLPSQLLIASFLGRTTFIWNDLHNCKWEKPE
jgi:hypothetical protein